MCNFMDFFATEFMHYIPAERRKATEQDECNNTSCPDVHLQAVTIREKQHFVSLKCTVLVGTGPVRYVRLMEKGGVQR